MIMHGVHKNQNTILNRLSRIEGQVRGIKKMVEEDVYCIDIIVQTSAIKQAISTIEDIMLESHLDHCLAEGSIVKTKISAQALNKEILKIYKLKRK